MIDLDKDVVLITGDKNVTPEFVKENFNINGDRVIYTLNGLHPREVLSHLSEVLLETYHKGKKVVIVTNSEYVFHYINNGMLQKEYNNIQLAEKSNLTKCLIPKSNLAGYEVKEGTVLPLEIGLYGFMVSWIDEFLTTIFSLTIESQKPAGEEE